LRAGWRATSADKRASNLAALTADLRAHHGRLSVTSAVGRGTRFDIRLPLDMAVIDGMIARIGDVRYVVPVSAIRRIVKPDAANLVHSSANGGQSLLHLEGESIQIQTFDGQGHSQDASNLMVIVEREHEPIAFSVDELIGRQQVLVRPLRGQFAEISHVSGCALLGEDQVGVVLDLE
jgi:two-component system chemotaxis sensor kinase CheA